MKLNSKDEIVKAVIKKMDDRSLVGQKKYGRTMMHEVKNGEKDLQAILVDVQQELMDSLLYIEAARRSLLDEIDDSLLKQLKIIDVQYEYVDV